MTMLTPLGSGGRSRGRSSSRRRWPKVLVALIVLAAVAAGAFATWRWLQDDTSSPSAVQPTKVCRTPTVASPQTQLHPTEVTVAVANGTDRAGLAVDTADQLAARGFQVTDIGNTDRSVKSGVAQVRYTPPDLPMAITVAAFIPGSELIELPNADKKKTVTLWLGPDFDRVLASSKADPTSVTLPAQKPVCHTPRL